MSKKNHQIIKYLMIRLNNKMIFCYGCVPPDWGGFLLGA